jgi:tetratricopeptide (TPR) repeat protein
MFDLRRWTVCRILAVFLCAFFVMEAHVLYAQQSAALAEQQTALFKTAREAYFAENYQEAKTVLEKLIEDLATIDGQDTFKGETYLLAGATYEKLDLLGPSVKYYCRAKALLGEGRTIEGLVLKELRYYRADCVAIGAILEAGLGQESDEMVAQYNQAKIGYFSGAYEASRAVLESLITSLGAIDGRDTFKGQVYLLAGAVYEVLKFKELAVKYYCRAKAILGEGVTIEGLKLDDLKYYKENCGGAAVAGAAVKTAGRKRSWFGGLFGMLLGLAIIGGLVWYLFFSKNAPLGKKGKYKSITFRIDIKYSGFNSVGHRKFTIGTAVKNDENFYYPQFINDPNVACNTATKEESYSYTYTLSGDSVVMKQDFLNWDYVSVPAGGAAKKLCAEYTITIDKYEYESGRDPGKPSAEGLENLKNTAGYNCTDITNRIKNCSMTATITFKAPASAAVARGVSSTYVEMNDKY